eukprot:scaffold1099_cov122-Isochrysis_galbana.AAC.3
MASAPRPTGDAQAAVAAFGGRVGPSMLDDTPPAGVDMEHKLPGLRAARNVPTGDAAQRAMAMEEGELRFDLSRAQRQRKCKAARLGSAGGSGVNKKRREGTHITHHKTHTAHGTCVRALAC